MNSILRNVDVALTRSLGASWAQHASAALHVGFLLLDSQGVVENATRTARNMFGVHDLEALRARWSSLQPDLAPVLAATTPEAPREVDLRYDADGMHYGVRCEFRACDGNDGAGYLVLVQSLDRVLALETALRLASRYQTLSAIQPKTVHDFKGSLNAISLHTALLKTTLGDSPSGTSAVQERCLRGLESELQELQGNVGTLLNESRADDAAVGRVDLGALLESVATLLRAHAKHQGVAITRVSANAPVDVTGRAGSLQQVILNLACNAIEAMPDGGDLRLELATDGEEAVLTVSDTGSGIPNELQERVWDLSFSTKPMGHGIGLHVVKQVVLAHGGRLDLTSASKGTRFVVRLPLAR